MTTEQVEVVRGIVVTVVRKKIKNLHLSVYPPDGRVRIAGPDALSDAAIHAAVASRLPWIRRQQASFRDQERETAREMVGGETHWYEGRRYRLRVVESSGRPRVCLAHGRVMELHVRPGATTDQKANLLDRWYRARLSEVVPNLIEKWAPRVGVAKPEWRTRHLKTRWGSCRPQTGRVWLNVELAKKARSHLEYVTVHELVHLRLRHHDRAFEARMDELLPHWRLLRSELGALPLGKERWPD
jgi:predicted metal-dependent hydrolase